MAVFLEPFRKVDRRRDGHGCRSSAVMSGCGEGESKEGRAEVSEGRRKGRLISVANSDGRWQQSGGVGVEGAVT